MRICQCSGVEAFLLGLWVSVAATESGSTINVTGSYQGEVVLPCRASEQLVKRVYWQRTDGELEVAMAAYFKNGDRCTTCSPGYANRTSFTGDLAHGNYSLNLGNLSLTDEGRYNCVVQLHNAPVKHHNVQLKVIAQYSEPSINVTRLENRHPSKQAELTCSSQGGYPEARVRWVNITDNGTFPEELIQTETKVDALGLYVLTSILRVNASSDPIACHIITNMAKDVKKSSEVHLKEQCSEMFTNIAAATNLKMPSFLLCLLMSSPSLFVN
ncbi:CD276 antigen homolog [Mustelus asterias]